MAFARPERIVDHSQNQARVRVPGDRFGTARTVGAGGALYVTGMLMIAMAGEGVMLTVGNALAGIGMAAAGFGPILGAIGRRGRTPSFIARSSMRRGWALPTRPARR
jgi:hypothetical protein